MARSKMDLANAERCLLNTEGRRRAALGIGNSNQVGT